MRLLIIDGRIISGSALPAERQLAAALGLSRTTVNAAYSALRADGFLVSRRGSGSFARVPGQPGETPYPESGDVIDLSRATSASAPGVHAAARRALERLPARLLTDGYELAGLRELQDALAARYAERGLPTKPEQIVVTSGAQSAISLVARTLLRRGEKVLVESPSYPHALDAFRNAGVQLIPTPVDALHGWDADSFGQLLRHTRPALAYLMPDFHNPTALSMTDAVRTGFVRHAETNDTIMLIDETTAELNIDRPWNASPLASFADRPELFLTVGSASKTIWGGLRVGWIRGEKSLIDRLVTARLANDLGAGVLDQLVAAETLPNLDSVLEFRRELHARSAQRLRDGIREHGLPWRVAPIAGGISAWVQFDPPASSSLAAGARSRGLLIGAGPWFGVDGAFERFMRIPITAPPESISRALDVLDETWSALGLSR